MSDVSKYDGMLYLDQVLRDDELEGSVPGSELYAPVTYTAQFNRLMLVERLRRRISKLKPIANLADDESSFEELVSALMKCQRKRPPLFYEYSPAYKLLERVEGQLGVHRVVLTDDDSRVVGSHGLTEGDLILSLSTRFKESCKQKAFIQGDRIWRDSVLRSIKLCGDFLVDMVEYSPSLSAVRLDHYAPSFWNMSEIKKGMEFHNEMFELSLVHKGLVGAVIRVSHLASIGWRNHICYIIEKETDPFVQEATSLWDEVTHGHGSVVTCSTGLRAVGCGPLADGFERLKWSLFSMLSRDQVMRLNVSGINETQFFRSSLLDTVSRNVRRRKVEVCHESV